MVLVALWSGSVSVSDRSEGEAVRVGPRWCGAAVQAGRDGGNVWDVRTLRQGSRLGGVPEASLW